MSKKGIAIVGGLMSLFIFGRALLLLINNSFFETPPGLELLPKTWAFLYILLGLQILMFTWMGVKETI